MYIEPFAIVWIVVGYVFFGHKVMFDHITDAKAISKKHEEEVSLDEYFIAYAAAAFAVAWWPIMAVWLWLGKNRRKAKEVDYGDRQ
ncbi:MAG: hypothetical protein COB23_03210 [Methylophaga sp.]|nr:MAG: hypothetical protein COB23_03210 [Methylophaga sp.]